MISSASFRVRKFRACSLGKIMTNAGATSKCKRPIGHDSTKRAGAWVGASKGGLRDRRGLRGWLQGFSCYQSSDVVATSSISCLGIKNLVMKC